MHGENKKEILWSMISYLLYIEQLYQNKNHIMANHIINPND
jgi:hypothetical protein